MYLLFFIVSLLSLWLLFSQSAKAQSGDQLFYDDFSKAKPEWQFIRDTWGLRDGLLAHDVYAIGAVYVGNDQWQDYEWETTFKITEYGNEHGSLTFFTRMSELWVGYGVTVNQKSIDLLRYDGAWNEKFELGHSVPGLLADKWYKLKVSIRGNQIEVYLDDQLLISAADPDNLYTHGSASCYADYTKAIIKEVIVTELEPGEIIQVSNAQSNDILHEDESNWPGYLPQGGSDALGAKHIMLWYSHFDWHEPEMLPYVAFGKRNNLQDPNLVKYVDWFYDTFLFLYNFGDCRVTPTDINKWNFWLDKLFAPGKDLDSFNNTVDIVREQGVANPDHKVKVILMIPHPSVEQSNFGSLDGTSPSLNFSLKDQSAEEANEQRFNAVKWYIDQCLQKIQNDKYNNLELVGFYWMEEAADSVDGLLIQRTSEYIHNRDLKLFWIPMFDAIGYKEWRQRGFDAVMMQPNYFWPEKLKPVRIERTAAMARKYHMGVEVEFDGSVANPFFRKRFYEYLDYGAKTRFMTDALVGYYEGGGGVLELFHSQDPELHELYIALYEFAKGTYKPRLLKSESK